MLMTVVYSLLYQASEYMEEKTNNKKQQQHTNNDKKTNKQLKGPSKIITNIKIY